MEILNTVHELCSTSKDSNVSSNFYFFPMSSNQIQKMAASKKEIESLKEKNKALMDQIEKQSQEAKTLMEEVVEYEKTALDLYKDEEQNKENLRIVHERNRKLQEEITELSRNIAQMEDKFDQDLSSARTSYQKTMEEQNNDKLDKLKQELIAAQLKLDSTTPQESKDRLENSDIRQKYEWTQYEEKLVKASREMKKKMQKEKKELECLMRSEMEKERVELRNSLRQTIEAELQEEFQRNMEMMVSQAKQACVEEEQLIDQAEIDKALADAKKQWEKELKRDIQVAKKRKSLESKLSIVTENLSECQQKLKIATNKMKKLKKLVEMDL